MSLPPESAIDPGQKAEGEGQPRALRLRMPDLPADHRQASSTSRLLPSSTRTLALLAVVVLLGGLARFWNLAWDGGAYSFHPDEWALNQVVRRLGPDLNPHFFFYGSFPVYLYRALAGTLSAATGIDWLAEDHLSLVGRFCSALASTAMLPLMFVAGKRLWGHGAGLLAAGFGASAALLIQAAHFGTVDTLLTLAGLALFLCALRIAEGAGSSWYLLSGLVLGLAIATKLSAISMVLFPLLAHLVRSRPGTPGVVRNPALLVAAAVGTALLASPYYLLDWREVWHAIVAQSDELSGGYKLPYTWQFIGSKPYLFETQNLVAWSLGWPLGLAALTGWAWALVQALRTRDARLLLLVTWPTLYLLYIGTWQARFVRHTLPLLPFCCLFAAGGLAALATWLKDKQQPLRVARYLPAALVAAGAAGWGLAFLSIYAATDTRIAATTWIRDTLPPGTHLVVEDKNDLIPAPSMPGPQPNYPLGVLQVTFPDTPSKMADFSKVLAEGEVLVVPNRRWSAVLPRMAAFPLTGRYYALLFSGALGYTPLATFSSPPRLGPLAFPDDTAEETFQVFDHPTVRLFRNTSHLSSVELLNLLTGSQ
jgi:hypothetical protein